MPENPASRSHTLVGHNYTTPDLIAKVTGRAKYAEDYRAEGMAIEPSSIVMTLENREQQPLLDVRIAIRPVGGQTEYIKLVSRLESGEKRTVSLGEFNGRDGTPFSLRVVRPKEIAVTATGLTNEKFSMTVPWSQ